MIEESETPGSGPPGRVGESDFLAERRARRATDTGEAALLRRAEAAEATVQTLESHVASLQQRLREAEEERRRVAELLEAERIHGGERESELRRAKQREYAEQQLRVEAEDRVSGLEREDRERAERLASRLSAGEQESGELARRIEELRRQLAEAEQSAAAERAGLRRAESELQARVATLERRAQEIERGLQAERGARERAERELAQVREGHRRMEGLLGEIRALVRRLAAVMGGLRAGAERTAPEPAAAPLRASTPRDPPPARPAATVAGQQRGMEMAEALAAAVERLRARALAAPPLPEDPGEPQIDTTRPEAPLPPDPRAPSPAGASPVKPSAAGAPRAPRPPAGAEHPGAGHAGPEHAGTEDTGAPVPPSPPTPPGRFAGAPPGNDVAERTAEPAEAPSWQVGAPGATDPAPPTPAPADIALQPPLTHRPQEAAPAYEIPLPLPGRPADRPAAEQPERTTRHKHSQSLLGRIRNRRKERRSVR